MAEAAIPVDLFNPGQVFACLGFLEAAEILIGEAAGGFDWSDAAAARFRLSAAGDENPFAHVLQFLAEAEVKQYAPRGYVEPPPKRGNKANDDDEGGNEEEVDNDESGDAKHTGAPQNGLELTDLFPAKAADRMSLPIVFGGGNRPEVRLTHWTDDDAGRASFKLYAGNRSADRIARAMLTGVRKKPSKKPKNAGQPADLVSKGLRQLWDDEKARLIEAPFDVLTPMGGSFNFDPRSAWTAIDAGYSPNQQDHEVNGSPVVQFLAAWGLEHARPVEFGVRQARYAVWEPLLPPALARAALTHAVPSLKSRRFRFDLDMSGKNKVVTFAEEEIQ